MKMRTTYGEEEIPHVRKSFGREKCPFCESKHKKGDQTVVICINRGPTGHVFYCIKHAKQLATEMLALTGSHTIVIAEKIDTVNMWDLTSP